jgi:hypothetical protein
LARRVPPHLRTIRDAFEVSGRPRLTTPLAESVSRVQPEQLDVEYQKKSILKKLLHLILVQ